MTNQIEQTHRVGLTCSRIAVYKDEAIITLILLVGIHEDVIDDLFAPYFEDLPITPSTCEWVCCPLKT